MLANKTQFVLFLLLVFSAVSLANAKQTLGLTDHVVISQIQISGVTAGDEFVELYNPTSNLIDLAGYRLSKRISTGTSSNLVASMSGTISPNSYFLIKSPGYTKSVSADATYSTLSTITADNTIILYSDAGTTIEDKVGFGTSFESETAPFPTNPGSGESLKRINNQDTDNNSFDFEILNVSDPRNSATVSATPTPTPTPYETPEPTPIPEDPTATPTPTPTNTPTPHESSSPTPTTFPTPTATPIPTNSPTSSPTTKPVATPKEHKDNRRHIWWGKNAHRPKWETFRFDSREIRCGAFGFGKLGNNFFRR